MKTEDIVVIPNQIHWSAVTLQATENVFIIKVIQRRPMRKIHFKIRNILQSHSPWFKEKYSTYLIQS